MNVILRDGGSGAISICATLDQIAKAWRSSLLSNEEESERKSSIYILREATIMDSFVGADIIKGMVQDDETDYIGTFNPISAEMEEQMLGVSDETNNHRAK